MESKTQRIRSLIAAPISNQIVLLRGRVLRQLIMLTAQFLLGMAVNLIGMPQETAPGTASIASTVFMALHTLVAVGLVIGAVITYRRAREQGPVPERLALWSGVSVKGRFSLVF